MRCLTIAAALGATACLPAQIDFVFISKLVDYNQTDASTVTAIANPYLIVASIDGSGVSSTYPVSPTVAVPVGSPGTITLTFDVNDNAWGFESAGYADQTALNAAYGSGNYTFQSSSFSSIALNLTNTDLYPNAPRATITTNTGQGFTWSGGSLIVDPNLFTTLTLTTNAFSTNFSATANHIGIHGDGFTSEVGAESFNTSAQTLSLNVSAASFLSGQSTKQFEIEFNNLITYTANVPNIGAESISAFTAVTTFGVQVIPEPSTYAVIVGGLALGGAMVHRRRRAKLA